MTLASNMELSRKANNILFTDFFSCTSFSPLRPRSLSLLRRPRRRLSRCTGINRGCCYPIGVLAHAAARCSLQIIGDDCGYNDFGYQNGGRTHTPYIDALVADGIELTSYHTYKVCAPSRASILSGRVRFCRLPLHIVSFDKPLAMFSAPLGRLFRSTRGAWGTTT